MGDLTAAAGGGAAALPLPGLSWNVVDDIRQLLQPHFMVNALEAGTIVAVLAGAIGWFMVLRHQAFAGHTLAVVSFPGAAGALLLGVSATAGYFAGAVGAALVIAGVPRSADGGSRSRESAVIGAVQAFALACGVLFVSLYGGFLNSLTGLLFGTFLGVSDSQVTTLLVVAAIALTVLAAIGRPLLFATIDPDVARVRGVPVRGLSVLFLLLLGGAVAEVSQITGALLIFALLVMPSAAAQRVTARPVASLLLTVVIAVATTWVGMGLAFFSVYPVGFYLTTVGLGFYLLTVLSGAVGDARSRRLRPLPVTS